jgi:hypothetical protein
MLCVSVQRQPNGTFSRVLRQSCHWNFIILLCGLCYTMTAMSAHECRDVSAPRGPAHPVNVVT